MMDVSTSISVTVPFTSWLAYMTFWMATGALKCAFGYYGLAEPLVIPLQALWNLEFDGQGTARSYSLLPNLLRCLVLILRVATPTCVLHTA